MSAEIEVSDDPARDCAALMLGPALGGGHIVLAGGSTPRRAYSELVSAVRAVDGDVTRATFWFGDERCVGPDDERSNFRMAHETLLEPLGLADGRSVRRIAGELGPEAAADGYERELREAGPPAFDLLLLGIGPDGHTASLFPSQATLEERERLVLAVPEAGLEPFVPRVSFGFAALGLARHVVLLAEGSAKADALAAAFGPGSKPSRQVPASILPTVAEKLTLLVDADAARGLGGPRA